MTDDALALEMSRHFECPMDRVWEAWTTPELMKKWFLGPAAEKADVDLQPGGAFRVGARFGPDVVQHVSGTYQLVEAPRRLAYTWNWEGPDGAVDADDETRISVELKPAGGGTEVSFSQVGLPDEEAVRAHTQGWGETFRFLEAIL